MTRHTLAALRKMVKAGPPYTEAFIQMLRADTRHGASKLYQECLARIATKTAREERFMSLLAFEKEAQAAGYARVAGVDEAGRGPLAGPIVAAAVILSAPVPEVYDSKKLTSAARDRLYARLHDEGHAIGVAVVDAPAIDEGGIQEANLNAMMNAVTQLKPPPDYVLVDGFALPGCPVPNQRLLKGDQRSMSIAAASIVAKVTRDRMMAEYDREHPGYGFAKHKGYGTKQHLEALHRLGPCPLHRRSFAPVALEQTGLFAQSRED